MFTKVLFAATFCIASVLSASADINTNKWTNAEGGDWSNAQNWSLGRRPQAADRVEFPDFNGVDYTINITGEAYAGSIFVDNQKSSGCPTVTFTGGGILNIKAVQENYIRGYRKLVLDGVKVNLTGHYIMIYGLLELQNSAQFLNGQETRLWRDTPSITVGEGCRMECVGTIRNLLSSTITVNGGEFICSSIISDKDSTSPVNVTVNGGIFSVKNGEFSNTPTLSMSDGLFRVESTATFPHGATYNFTGGTLEVPILNPPQELLANKGNATIAYPPVDTVTMTTPDFIETFDNSAPLVFTSSSDFVFDFWQNNGVLGKEVNINGIVVVTNGCINFNREGYLYSDYPMFVKTFRIGSHNGSDTYGAPTIGVSEIVVGNEYPFATFDKRNPVYYKEFNLEGPTIIKPTADVNAPTGNETVLCLSGDIVVDTQDYSNPDLTRTVRLYNVCAKDFATLSVTGGGKLHFSQAQAAASLAKITVGENTTLVLEKMEGSLNYSPLYTEKIVLGKNAKIEIPAGGNSIHAAAWEVDHTAKIFITLEEGLSRNPKGLMYDLTGDYRIPENQISLKGKNDSSAALDGWGLHSAAGTWVLTNAFNNVVSYSKNEWTGAGASSNSDDSANWTNGGNSDYRPLIGETYSFGANASNPNPNLNKFYQTDEDGTVIEPANGMTISGIKFRDTAINSFSVNAEKGMEFANSGSYDSAAIVTYSTVPQILTGTITASAPSIFAACEAPVIINGQINASTKFLSSGDVRFKNTTLQFTDINSLVTEQRYTHLSTGNRISLVDGANVEVLNKTDTFSTSISGFKINEGCSMSFRRTTSSARHLWQKKVSYSVDGVLNIDSTFCGGADNSYSGSGTLNINMTILPRMAPSRITFSDNLSVHLPAQWPTLTAAYQNCPITIKAIGTPTIYTEGDWSYGVFDEITNQEYTPSKRAAKIAKSSTLTFNPNGGTVTFGDPLSGKGTVAIMNGTLYIPGGVASSIGVKMCDEGAYRYDAAHELRSLVFEAGSKLRFTAPITVKERVNLDNLQIEWAEGTAPGRSKVWKTLLVSKAGFDGESAALDSKYHTRVANTDNGYEYQVRPKIGAVVTFR